MSAITSAYYGVVGVDVQVLLSSPSVVRVTGVIGGDAYAYASTDDVIHVTSPGTLLFIASTTVTAIYQTGSQSLTCFVTILGSLDAR